MSVLPVDDPIGGGDAPSVFEAATTILENLIAGLAQLYATSKPTGVPALDRDRWVDVNRDVCPVAWVSGWKDAPAEGQNKDSPVDFRTLSLTLDAQFVSGTTTASAQLDLWRQWVQFACLGIPEAGSPIRGIAIRVRLGEQAAVVAEDGLLRAYMELLVDYRVLTNSATNWG